MAILFLISVGGKKANNNFYKNICTDIKIIQTEAAAWQRDQHTQRSLTNHSRGHLSRHDEDSLLSYVSGRP